MKSALLILALGFQQTYALDYAKCSQVGPKDKASCMEFAKKCSPHEQFNAAHCKQNSPEEAKIKTVYDNGMASMGEGYRPGSEGGKAICAKVQALRQAQHTLCSRETTTCASKSWSLPSGTKLDCNDFNENLTGDGGKVCVSLDDETKRILDVWKVEGSQCGAINSINGTDG